MNGNPHLQYLQQLHLQQQSLNAPVQSPQLSQLQIQQQLQRQQLLSHHLQQQQQQQQQQLLQQQRQRLTTPIAQHVSTNPLLAVINGNGNTSQAPNNPFPMQLPQQYQQQNLQYQQQYQQQLQQQQQQQQQQHLQHAMAAQVPVIKEVWAHNLEYEFQALRTFISDPLSKVFVAIHQEIPGIVARPVGTFKSSSDYHFQTLRSNADLLNMIQLSFCMFKIKNNETSSSVIWQFNFLYDLATEMYNEEHLNMLAQTCQINFQLHMAQGIPRLAFAELLIDSGLLLDESINWISYHAGYDLGFFISLLLNDSLPVDEKDFYWWAKQYLPNLYDLKFLGSQLLDSQGGSEAGDAAKQASNKPSIEYLAEELHLLPISPAIRQHFAASSTMHYPGNQQQISSTLHAYLSIECFKELLRKSAYDLSVLERFKGCIWGLGNLNSELVESLPLPAGATSTPQP